MKENKSITFQYKVRKEDDGSNSQSSVRNETNITLEVNTSTDEKNQIKSKNSMILINICLIIIRFGTYFLHK